ASACAIAITAAWPSLLGAVKLALPPPSLLTAAPRTTAYTGLPSATASDRRLSSTTAAPSLNTVPVASASKLRVLPSADSIPPSWYRERLLTGQVTATPPASAMPQRPARRVSMAWGMATSEVEQAVCTLIAGPVRLSLCDTRVAM